MLRMPMHRAEGEQSTEVSPRLRTIRFSLANLILFSLFVATMVLLGFYHLSLRAARSEITELRRRIDFLTKRGDPIPVSLKLKQGYTISQPLSIQKIESDSIKALRKEPAGVPRVPLGYRNHQWECLKAMVRPGDQIVFMRSSPESWDGDYGDEGYALIRDGNIIVYVVTFLN